MFECWTSQILLSEIQLIENTTTLVSRQAIPHLVHYFCWNSQNFFTRWAFFW